MMNSFAAWHRSASENLLAATSSEYDDITSLSMLQTTTSSGIQALLAAGNLKERMLAMGLLQTCEGIRIIVEHKIERLPN